MQNCKRFFNKLIEVSQAIKSNGIAIKEKWLWCRKRAYSLTSTTQLLMVESLKLKISWTSWPTRFSSSSSSQVAKALARPTPGGESSSSKGARWCISGVGSIVAAARLQIAPLLAANVKSILGPGQRGVGV